MTLVGFAQQLKQHTYTYSDVVVESFYNKATNKPIYIFNDFNGKIVDTLYNIDDENAWYKIAIIDSEYGWFKIKNIQRLPSSHKNFNYENHWVRVTNFLTQANNYNESQMVYLYDLPSFKANKIHKMDDYQIVSITEINGQWSKVKFVIGNKKIEGWLNNNDQCPYPWTTCPKYE